MDKLKEIVEGIKTELANIETDMQEATDSGKFNYTRSKNIRKSAMEIAKGAKELRVACLDEFKSRKAE